MTPGDGLRSFVEAEARDQQVLSTEDLAADASVGVSDLVGRLRRYRDMLRRVARSDHELADRARTALMRAGDWEE